MGKKLEKATVVSQTELAAIIGRPSHWLRTHAHEVPRRGDGMYDAPEVVDWLIKTRRVEPAVLTDAEFEAALKFSDAMADALGHDAADLLEFLAAMEVRYAVGGLVAFTAIVREQLKATAEQCGPRPSDDELRERHDRQLATAIAENVGVIDQTVICEVCGKQRFGRGWIKRVEAGEQRAVYGYCEACKTV